MSVVAILLAVLALIIFQQPIGPLTIVAVVALIVATVLAAYDLLHR